MHSQDLKKKTKESFFHHGPLTNRFDNVSLSLSPRFISCRGLPDRAKETRKAGRTKNKKVPEQSNTAEAAAAAAEENPKEKKNRRDEGSRERESGICRRALHAMEVSRPHSLRLVRQSQPRLAFPLLQVSFSLSLSLSFSSLLHLLLLSLLQSTSLVTRRRIPTTKTSRKITTL